MSNYIEQGKKHLDRKEYTKALEYFQAAIQDNPSCSEAYLFLSDCYYIMGRVQQAQSTIYILLAQDPDNRQAKRRLNNIQKAETKQNASPQINQPSSQTSQSTTNFNTSLGQNKRQSPPINIKLAGNKKWDWSTKNIISGVIGLILFLLSILGIIGCLPINGEPLDYSFEWAYLSLFILITIFSTCMIISPRIKPSWNVKNIILSILGLLLTPLCVALLVYDFEESEMMIFMGILCLVFVFAPFIRTD